MLGLQGKYEKLLARLALASMRRPIWVLLAGLAVAASSLVYGWYHLPLNGRQDDMVSRDVPFQKLVSDINAAFPEQTNTILVAVTGEKRGGVERAAERILREARRHPDAFLEILYPQAEPFFRKNGLIYLSVEDLERFTSRLAEMQPALAHLSQGGTLLDIFNLLGSGLEARYGDQADLPDAFGIVARSVADALQSDIEGRAAPDIWDDAFPEWAAADQDPIRVILIRPRMDFSKLLPAAKPIGILREITSAARQDSPDIRVGLTGREVLDHEQMESIGRSVSLASLVSAAALFILLFVGTGSLLLTIAILFSLGLGICWCIGYAALAVGELNMISSSFLILYMGIGVAFMIHIALRFMEEKGKTSGDESLAMSRAAGQTGKAVTLCALTSAAGFLSFVPTQFDALGDMGIIAGGALMLALFSALTMLPALLSLLPQIRVSFAKQDDEAFHRGGRIYPLIQAARKPISLSAFILALAAVPIASNIGFNYSALNFKDPNAESVRFLKELRERDLYTDYTISFLARNEADADFQAQRLAELPTVLRVDTHRVYVPEDQEIKYEMIDDASSFLPPETASGEKANAEAFLSSARELRQMIGDALRAPPPPAPTPSSQEKERDLREALAALAASLDRFLAMDHAGARLRVLNDRLMEGVPEQVKRLRESLTAEPFTFEDLPPSVRRQVQAADGRIRVIAYPNGDISDLSFVVRFIREAQGVVPNAIGLPIAEYEVGQITVEAFRFASLIAFVVISAFLFALLRRPRNVFLTLLPILMTASFTLATCALLGISLNFVNILVLPLILGLGVDNGIHILSRAEAEKNVRAAMSSSTPLAVMLSNLATLATFGSIMLSPHMGMASMGYTLTIAMLYSLLSALVILPAMLAWVRERERLRLSRAEPKEREQTA